jgi:hypothetical protein
MWQSLSPTVPRISPWVNEEPTTTADTGIKLFIPNPPNEAIRALCDFRSERLPLDRPPLPFLGNLVLHGELEVGVAICRALASGLSWLECFRALVFHRGRSFALKLGQAIVSLPKAKIPL